MILGLSFVVVWTKARRIQICGGWARRTVSSGEADLRRRSIVLNLVKDGTEVSLCYSYSFESTFFILIDE